MQNIFILVLLALFALVSQQRYLHESFDHVHQRGIGGLGKVISKIGSLAAGGATAGLNFYNSRR